MKIRSVLALVAVVATSALVGCARDTSVDVEGAGAAQRMGYVPKVTLADLRAAGARCVGTTCTLNGVWDCKGGKTCTKVSS